MFPEVEKLYAQGSLEQAFTTAKKLSIDLLRKNDRVGAAVALSQAGVVLCSLNIPSKAKSFSQEAYDLATREHDSRTAGFAETIRALAHLRLGEYERAESALDHAIDLLGNEPDEFAALARVVAAQISLSQEDLAEARAFAEDAYAVGASTNSPAVKARARMIKAICEERTSNYDTAIELLNAAEQELKQEPHAVLTWEIKAAMANVCSKSGQEDAAKEHRREATRQIEKIAETLNPQARERFFQNPAVRSAFGEDSSNSGMWRVPLQIAPPKSRRLDSDTKTAARLRPIFDIIKKINSELNLRKLITLILDTMIEYCNAQRGTLVIFEGERYKIELSRNRHKENLKKHEMGISRTILQQVRDTGKEVLIQDAQAEGGLKLVDSVHDQQLLSILCVPLRVKTRLIGAVYIDNPHVADAFGEHEMDLAGILTDQAAVAIDNALLRIRSIHDALTSLYNHPHFEKRLELEVNRARRHGRRCGLIMIDLDNFKEVNDNYGHEAGNEVLRATARMIAGATRNVDLVARVQEKDRTPVVARYGGDEFEVILPDTDREGLERVAQRLIAAATETRIPCGTGEVQIFFSIGGACYPEDAADHRTLLLRADEALYAAKRAGKNRFVLYQSRDSKHPEEAAKPS